MRTPIWPVVFRRVAVLVVLLLAIVCRADDYGRLVEQKFGLYPDFAANLRVQMVGHRLARAAELPNITFKILNDRELNAMALPDGRIYITSAMATMVTDDELAFVLGHELTHIKQGHAKNQMQKATGGAILGAILIAVLGGSEGDIRTGADIAGGLTMGHYSRKDEQRADAGGVTYMAMAGYDAQRAAGAMQRLIDRYGRGDAGIPVLGWFATHPDTQNRKERILAKAAELQAKPPATLHPPLGIQLTLDPSAQHAAPWLRDYLAIRLAAISDGQAVVLREDAGPAVGNGGEVIIKPWEVAQPDPPAENPPKNTSKQKPDKDAPLPEVTVVVPPVPAAYRVTVGLRDVPFAGGGVTKITGTAVEAALQWTEVATGFTGTSTAIAQTRKAVPWTAQEQLHDMQAVTKLADGKSANVEGTLEAVALRRAAMALAEVLENTGPIDHSAPVSFRMDNNDLLVNDAVDVVRGNLVVAQIRVNTVNGRDLTGTVLWGVHTWKKGDKFVRAEE